MSRPAPFDSAAIRPAWTRVSCAQVRLADMTDAVLEEWVFDHLPETAWPCNHSSPCRCWISEE